MQLVVEISEDTFFDLKKKQNRTEVDNAVLQGTPLPKGHGRLIDADRIVRTAEKGGFGNNRDIDFVLSYIPKCKTIIEADKENGK